MEARPGRWPVTENESSVIAKGTRPVSAAQMAHDARHVMFFTKTFRCLHCMAQVALTARSSLSRCPHFKHARGQTCKEQGKSDEFSDDDDSGATLIELVHGQVKADVIARRIREHAEGFACRRMAGAHDTEPSFVRKRSAEMGEISRLQNRGVAARLCAVGVRERGQEQTRHERDDGVVWQCLQGRVWRRCFREEGGWRSGVERDVRGGARAENVEALCGDRFIVPEDEHLLT